MPRGHYVGPFDAQITALTDEGHGPREIGRQLGINESSVRKTQDRLGLRSRLAGAPTEDEAPLIDPGLTRPRLSHVLDLNPAGFAVPIPRPAPSSLGQAGKYQTTVVYTDTHFPHHDPSALAVVLGIIRDVRPSRIVHLGDLLDCYTISSYSRDRNHAFDLQDEIDQGRAHLHNVSEISPESEKVWLLGNHEDRLDRQLNSFSGTAAELTQLRAIRDQLTWRALLRTDEIGWDVVPVHGQAQRSIIPKLITKHGDVVRRWSGMSAKGEWERYGRSGVSGHVHRVGQFYTSDFNGNHVWTECGCTCDLKPSYMQDPNWAQACVLVHHTPDGSRFAVEPVYIEKGRALFRSTEYRADAA